MAQCAVVGSVLSSSRTGDLDIQVENQDNPSQNPDHDLDLDELPSSSRRDSKKSWTVKAKRMHRVVEQVDEEPIGIVIFKWCLIFIGSAMLGKFVTRWRFSVSLKSHFRTGVTVIHKCHTRFFLMLTQMSEASYLALHF